MARNARSSRITVSLNISSRLKRFQGQGVQAAYDLAFQMAEDAAEIAKANVEPGVGPGPHNDSADKWGHPNPHEDYGDLRDSVQFRVERQGFLAIAQVYTDLEYGAWLEIGWHTSSGSFFRYPWMKPAFDQVTKNAASDLPNKLYRTLTESGSKSAGAIDEPEIRQWIRKEELEHFYYTEE